MANYTDYLNLFEWDLDNEDDLKSKFDIKKALNENWDKIDEVVKASDTNIALNADDILKIIEILSGQIVIFATENEESMMTEDKELICCNI